MSTQSKLEKIYNEAQEDFALTVLNLSDKTRAITSIKSKWLFRIVKEEKLLAKMKDAQQEMVSQLASLTRKLQPGSIRVKNEAIKSDELAELTEQITEQEECVRFLHLILDNQIKSITWDIKNAIEQSKLESM
jgi:uncharacterized protein with NAD-binding domain and iron-sulfur cluster